MRAISCEQPNDVGGKVRILIKSLKHIVLETSTYNLGVDKKLKSHF